MITQYTRQIINNIYQIFGDTPIVREIGGIPKNLIPYASDITTKNRLNSLNKFAFKIKTYNNIPNANSTVDEITKLYTIIVHFP